MPKTHFDNFERDTLCRFLLTVRKNYRPVPYHGWAHGFSVAHVLFLVFTGSPETFTTQEKLGMFFGAICHDIDHRGFNNTFLRATKSPLGLLYETSTMEWHHFEHTLYLLQIENLNIFHTMEKDQYSEVISTLQQTILDTDIIKFSPVHMELEPIVQAGEFDMKNERHRVLMKHELITAADLCAAAKPWNIHRQSVKNILDEFYNQGDQEKAMGYTPIPIMDRDKKNMFPKTQVTFFSAMAIKCYAIIYALLPCTETLFQNARDNLEEWKRLAGVSETNENNVSLKKLENMYHGRRDSIDN